MTCKTEMTNAERLRELAWGCMSFGEFQDKAIKGVMLKMTISEFEREMENMKSSDLQDYFEKIKNGGGK